MPVWPPNSRKPIPLPLLHFASDGLPLVVAQRAPNGDRDVSMALSALVRVGHRPILQLAWLDDRVMTPSWSKRTAPPTVLRLEGDKYTCIWMGMRASARRCRLIRSIRSRQGTAPQMKRKRARGCKATGPAWNRMSGLLSRWLSCQVHVSAMVRCVMRPPTKPYVIFGSMTTPGGNVSPHQV
ncbi:hypothetical protein LZ31DRAFT_139534 [Colletotrichum somersetense]|nr:hypothetical protein LZ31DRAFT_139534 [Colletotrichum somersetense]